MLGASRTSSSNHCASIWALLGSDQPPCYRPEVPFILWAMALPFGSHRYPYGSWFPNLVRLVCPLQQPHPCGLTPLRPVTNRVWGTFRSLRYCFWEGDHHRRPVQTTHHTLSCLQASLEFNNQRGRIFNVGLFHQWTRRPLLRCSGLSYSISSTKIQCKL